MDISQWSSLIKSGSYLSAIELHPFDKSYLLHQFYAWGQDLGVPVYLFNPGYAGWQQVQHQDDSIQLHPAVLMQNQDDEASRCGMDECMQWLMQNPTPGIFLLEGLMPLSEQRRYQLMNVFEQSRWTGMPCYWVILDEAIDLPPGIQGMIPTLSLALPNRVQTGEWVSQWCANQGVQDVEGRLARAATGLSRGELSWILHREWVFVDAVTDLAVRVLDYKTSKLKGRGLELINAPDVPDAGGMDLLEARLERIVALLDPIAAQHKLSFPKGMILWGPPGTGKSLSAKLCAGKMGVPLLAADWNGLRGKDATESLQNLRWLLDTAESMAPCVLYWDDFDKGFAGWDTDMVAKASAQRLLTWMQERVAPVFVMATVNRLGMLPIELTRPGRVDDIFFVDLPHDGARYDVFNLHLAKYFPEFRNLEPDQSPWTEKQWRALLTEYRLCTPAEIANAVKRVAEEQFYQNALAGHPEQGLVCPFNEMLQQRERFTPAMVREEGAMLEIRNNATFAQPVSSLDTSRFARAKLELFG